MLCNAFVCSFLWVEVLRPSEQFFSHVGTFSWVEPVLSYEDDVSCSRAQHLAPGEIRTRNFAIKSPALYRCFHCGMYFQFHFSVLPCIVLIVLYCIV